MSLKIDRDREQERIDNIESRQDFPGAVITGHNDGQKPDFTPITEDPPPGWDAQEPAELPYGETPPTDGEA